MLFSSLAKISLVLFCSLMQPIHGSNNLEIADKTIIARWDPNWRSAREEGSLEDEAVTHSHRVFQGYSPDIFEKDITTSNRLFRVALLGVQPNPTPFAVKIASELKKWQESKHVTVEGDGRSETERLMDFAIVALLAPDKPENLEFFTVFERNFKEMINRLL